MEAGDSGLSMFVRTALEPSVITLDDPIPSSLDGVDDDPTLTPLSESPSRLSSARRSVKGGGHDSLRTRCLRGVSGRSIATTAAASIWEILCGIALDTGCNECELDGSCMRLR